MIGFRRTLGSAAIVALLALAACGERASVTAPQPTPETATPRAVVAVVELPTLVITEIMADPSAVLDDVGEYFEVFNPGTQPVDINGWRIISGPTGSETHTVSTSFTIQPCAVAVLVRNGNAAVNGGIAGGYAYGTGITLNNGSTDFVVLKRADNTLSDSVSYSVRTAAGAVSTPTFMPSAGRSRVLVDPALDNTNIAGNSNWIDTPVGTTYGAGDRGTPGVAGAAYAAACGNTQQPGVAVTVTVTPNPATVAPNATTTLNATARDANNLQTPTTFTWTSANESVATVSATGVVTGIVEGSAVISATSANGKIGTATVNVALPAPASVSIAINTPRSIPAGFVKPSFPTVRDQNNAIISPAPVLTWSTSDAAIATVDALGYITGVSPGTVTVRATAPNGVFGTNSITILPASVATPAVYRNHLEFGTPADATPADEQIIARTQFTSSWNNSRGAPNWVSWNLNASQFGDADRCDCFSPDLQTPAPRVVDFNYRNGGYDRGHMVQSESRTSTFQENAATFLLSNIIPQAGNNNQGPWSAFENYLNDLARTQGKEIYVIAGGEYTPAAPSLKGEGRVFVPDYTWKVAVIRPGGAGLLGLGGANNVVEVIAVRMPNRIEPGIPASAAFIRNTPWPTFKTTVDQIEANTGYDLLSALPDGVETVLESGKSLPMANAGSGYQAAEGTAIQLSAAASTDADNDIASYSWTFGDGATGSGVAPSHVYADNGTYAVTLLVTDALGGTSTATTSVVVANVAPMLPTFSGAMLFPGETYATTGTFLDPGADTFTATVDYGTGFGEQPLTVGGFSFALSHIYTSAGTFTVTVRVRDDDDGVGTRSATVTVNTVAQGIAMLSDVIDALAQAGAINKGNANALSASLRNAAKQIARHGTTPAKNMLGAFINKVQAFERSSRFTEQQADELIALAERLIRSLDTP